jgi:CubicO group peptidase (beta-lactamase class C family)
MNKSEKQKVNFSPAYHLAYIFDGKNPMHLFFIITISILAVACSKAPGDDGSIPSTNRSIATVDSKQVDELISNRMKEYQVPGLSVAINHNGKLIYSQTYGLADLEHSSPVHRNSSFKIASLTKPITAIATMQLVERGEVELDRRISHYISNLPKAWEAITVRQAMSHTSGLADYFRAPDWSWKNSWRIDLSHEEFIAMCSKSPPDFPPGEQMKYSNTGYYLLGMLIEAVAKTTYADYISKNIFDRAGMSNSRLDNAKAIVTNRVRGYHLENGKHANAEFTSDTWAYSEGGVLTTAIDLAKLDSALHTETLLSRSTIQQLWTPAKLNDGTVGVIGDNGAGKPNHYGLGWFLSEYKGYRLILAGGNKPGYTCTYFKFADSDLSIIVVSNLSNAPLYAMAGAIAELYLQM